MGVPPNVQPTFADIIHTANKKLGYTALVGVPPKVQSTFADIIHTANKKLGYTALVCHLKYSLRLILIIQLTKNCVQYTALMCAT